MKRTFKGHKRWTEREEAKLIELFNQGLTNKEICEQLNRDKNSITHRIQLLKERKEINGTRRSRTSEEVYNSNADRIINNFKAKKLKTKHKIAESTAKISEANHKAILWLDQLNESQSLAKNSRANYIIHLRQFGLYLGKKQFKDVDLEKDIIPYISKLKANLQETGWKPHWSNLKFFYNQLAIKHPEAKLSRVTAYFNTKSRGRKKNGNEDKIPEHLSKIELVKIISGIKGKDSRAIRDRALISVLYDTGARLSELIAVTKDNCFLDGNTPYIHLPISKTRPRNSPLLNFCLPYLNEWIKVHEFWNQDNSPLFYSMSTANYGEPIAQAMAGLIVRRARRISGIKRKITPHTLRHSKVYHLATAEKPLIPAEANKLFGWGKTSNFYNYYSQARESEIKARELEAAGKLTPEQLEARKQERNAFVSTSCNRCHTKILPDQFVCPKCGLAKNKKVQEIQVKERKESEDKITNLQKIQEQQTKILAEINKKMKYIEKFEKLFPDEKL